MTNHFTSKLWKFCNLVLLPFNRRTVAFRGWRATRILWHKKNSADIILSKIQLWSFHYTFTYTCKSDCLSFKFFLVDVGNYYAFAFLSLQSNSTKNNTLYQQKCDDRMRKTYITLWRYSCPEVGTEFKSMSSLTSPTKRALCKNSSIFLRFVLTAAMCPFNFTFRLQWSRLQPIFSKLYFSVNLMK